MYFLSPIFDNESCLFPNMINEALIKIYPLIDLKKVFALIEEIDVISDIHKQFYKTMIQNRYDKIIKYSYEKLVGEKK